MSDIKESTKLVVDLGQIPLDGEFDSPPSPPETQRGLRVIEIRGLFTEVYLIGESLYRSCGGPSPPYETILPIKWYNVWDQTYLILLSPATHSVGLWGHKMQYIEGYVAFLDILGFSQLVMGKSFSMEFEQYSGILSKAVQTDDRDLQYVTFSDSIIINTKHEDEEHLQHLVQAIAEITFLLLTELGLPICGSISRGRFWRYQDDQSASVIIAGPPIIDAYRFEQKQDWIGVILSPEVLKHNPTLLEYCQLKSPSEIEEAKEIQRRFPWPLLIQRYERIPFKKQNEFDNPTFDGIVIVPQHRMCQEPTELIVDLDKCRDKLDQMLLFASEPSEQSKYRATLSWISDAKQNWEWVLGRRVWSESLRD